MKNNILTLLLCVASYFASAQFTLVPKIQKVQDRNYTTPNGGGGVTFICTITNNATSNLDTAFIWRVLRFNPPPAWTISFCDPANCYGSINFGMSNEFYLSKGASGQMHSTYTFNNIAGSDTLVVTIQSKLTSSIDTFVVITNSWMTGIKEINASNQLSFYPNPVKDYLNVKYTPSSAFPVIDIYNIIGVKVKSVLYDANSTNINVSDIKNGMYILRITDGNNSYSKTFNKAD
jgi:Secretion system C-terminal sorting domain